AGRDAMNTETPRIFIAATRQNDGKTTASLGLLSALQQCYPRIGYIKPVGQRFVEIEEQKIDEDTVLMDSVFQLNCPLVDMSPIAVEPDFTRKYLQSSNRDALVRRIEKAFDRVAWEKDFVLCEGSGHAGVGMTRAFAQNKIFFPGHAVEGFFDAAHEGVAVGGLQVFAREIRLHGDRAHVHQRTVQLKHAV